MKLEEIIKECQVYIDPRYLRICCPVCENHNFVDYEIDYENRKIVCFCGICKIRFEIMETNNNE